MSELKLTKNGLRDQQQLLTQLQKYLPTLQLKKAMLQAEVHEVRLQIGGLRESFQRQRGAVEEFSALLAEQTSLDLSQAAKVKTLAKRYENVAGVEVPYFESIEFEPLIYNLFETPAWVDGAVAGVRALVEACVRVEVAEEQKAALEKELREVSIRVSLFEKILIPRALKNIKKIKVFLGDQQLAAVSQAKVAKAKKEQAHAH